MIGIFTWSQVYGKKMLKETIKETYAEGAPQVDSLNILKM
jgi:hypothetical protein